MKTWCLGVPGQSPSVFVTCFEKDINLNEGEVVVYMPNYPPPPHIISEDGTEVIAVDTLDRIREEVKAYVKGYFLRQAEKTCEVASIGEVQCDPASRAIIDYYATQAIISVVMQDTEWKVGFTLADNVKKDLTAHQMIAVSKAVANNINENHDKSKAAVAVINAAQTRQDLLEILEEYKE